MSEQIKHIDTTGLSKDVVEQQKPITTTSSDDVLDNLRAERDCIWAPIISPAVDCFLTGRKEVGVRKYGVGLQTNNGRDVTIDLKQELGDVVMYAHQGIMEGKRWKHIRRWALEALDQILQDEQTDQS